MTIISRVDLLNGGLSIGHRPSKKLIPHLKDLGVSHVVSILGQQEEPDLIKKVSEKNHLKWDWIKLGSAKPTEDRNTILLVQHGLQIMIDSLKEGHYIYLHCSAGIHRTGTVAFALLLKLNLSVSEAEEHLRELRVVTAD